LNARSQDTRTDQPSPIAHARRATIVAAAFLLFLAIVPLWDQLGDGHAKSHQPRAEDGQELSFWKGDLARGLETQLLQRSVLRDPLLPPWSLFLYCAAAEVPGELRVGRDGWLFLSNRLEVPIQRQQEVIRSLVERMNALRLRLRSIGVRLVLLPIPTKAWVHPNKTPLDCADTASFHHELLEALASQGVEAIDVLAALQRFGDSEAGFCRTDSHWNWKGALAAAEAIANRAHLTVPETDRTSELRSVARFPDVGDLARMIGFDALLHRSPNLLQTLRRLGLPFGEQEAFTVVTKGGLPASPLPWKGNSDAPLLVAGTSFSAWPEFDRYLQHATGGRTRLVASRGGGLCTSLLLALRQILSSPSEFPPPTTIVLEFPTANVWTEERPWDDFGSLFALLPAPHLEGVTILDPRDPKGSFQPGTLKLTATRQTMRMNNRDLQHEGYGHVSLRLRGKVQQGTALVMLTYGGDSVFALWEQHQTEIVLPLPASTAIATVEIALSAPAGPAELDLKGIERVLRRPTHRWSSNTSDAVVGTESISLIPLTPSFDGAARGTLLIGAQEIHKLTAGFQVELMNVGRVLTSRTGKIHGDDPCRWLMPFELGADDKLTHLRVTWTGPTPKRFFAEIAFE
jgi:hypothetical protein